MTVDQFITDYIRRWEGGMSKDRNDNGNWFLYGAAAQKVGQGVLVGSNFGVTGATLAHYRGVKAVTMADMERLSLPEACAIAKSLFYTGPQLDRLAWSRVTASILDFGWGAGPVRAVKLLQDLLDLVDDGRIGPVSVAAFAKRLQRSEEAFAGAWWAMREKYYEGLVERRPTDGIYLKGWDSRSDYFTPGHPEGWWARFGA